ncbi:hypothetical protein BOTNAR_0314g00050 [Botryotinia narcissicola]|uniref:Uncharacterized protein n=1 Tax=Botryotinia narcissicola TaxID=278944 RepID=A0A4Z1HZV7_9HELO|nr:hypothetical protein BOTNAR_0314g00050 [Botryotinia narcissicola]
MDGSGFSFLAIQGEDADDDDDDDNKTIKTQWNDCTILYSLHIVDADTVGIDYWGDMEPGTKVIRGKSRGGRSVKVKRERERLNHRPDRLSCRETQEEIHVGEIESLDGVLMES